MSSSGITIEMMEVSTPSTPSTHSLPMTIVHLYQIAAAAHHRLIDHPFSRSVPNRDLAVIHQAILDLQILSNHLYGLTVQSPPEQEETSSTPN